jgi:ribonuclease P protein component
MRRDFRILKNKEFERLFQIGKKKESDQFSVYYLKNNTKTRIGICLGKKFGNSVKRNLAKRQVRSMLDQLDYQIPIDMIILLKLHYTSYSYQDNKTKLLLEINKCQEAL